MLSNRLVIASNQESAMGHLAYDEEFPVSPKQLKLHNYPTLWIVMGFHALHVGYHSTTTGHGGQYIRITRNHETDRLGS